MNKNLGFSLAEVLITLGVIGLVAAMTIPTLISYTNGAKFRSQFKKTVSTLNQASLMAKAKYGFDFAGTDRACSPDPAQGGNENPEEHMTFCSILNGTLKGYTYYGKVTNLYRVDRGNSHVPYRLETRDTIPDNYTDYLAYSLNDGIIIAFHPEAKECELPIGRRPVQDIFSGPVNGTDLSKCVGFIDVNGVSLPNREVNCSAGVNKVDAGSNCIVDNTASHMLDVFPIVYHDTTVEPASGAALFVLGTAKL